MPTPADVRTAIEAKFAPGELALIAPAVRVVFDDETSNPQPPGPWVKLSIRTIEHEQQTIGRNPLFRTSASVFLEVRTKGSQVLRDNLGEAVIQDGRIYDNLSLQLANVLSSKKFNEITFQAATQREFGSDGPWFLVIIEVPFEYYGRATEE